jgi:S-DNA-T family DNA segregation ATPase FtsK/SpoIIIE
MRLTVEDDATGIRSDVHVHCAPSHQVGDVVAAIGAALPVHGTPVVDGAPLPLDGPVAGSPLREGCVLRYGRPPGQVPPPEPPLVLRVVSGPAAGTELPLVPGSTVVVGRAPSCRLVLDDPDVSRRHAQLVVGPRRVTIADLGSRNGVQVDGHPVAGDPDVHGKVIQIGGSRMVVQAPGEGAATVERGERGEVLFHRTPWSRPAAHVPPTVALPARPVADERGWWAAGRRRRQHAEQAHRSAVTAARALVEAAADDEDAALRAAWPDPATTVRTALTPRTALWARRPSDDDWLAVRLGRADRPAGVRVTGEPPSDWLPPVLRLAPVGVSLLERPVLGLTGPPDRVDGLLAWVVTQLAVHHGPDELRLVVVAPDAGEEQLGWVRWLPHLRAGDGTVRAAWDGAVPDFLDAQLRGSGPERRPDLVVVLAGTAGLDPRLTALLQHASAAGLRFVCAETDERLLPESARTRLVATAGGDAVLHVDGGRFPVVDDAVEPATAELVARALAPVHPADAAPPPWPPAPDAGPRAVAVPWFDVAAYDRRP